MVEVALIPAICRPLCNLQEVFEWKPLVCRTKLQPRSGQCVPGSVLVCPKESCEEGPLHRVDARSVPRTLVCHDMKGGYLDDRFIHGSQDPDAYQFFHWAGIDLFVYFSHKFVTIPPPGWIHVAHQHGVKVLGTVITEWEEGARLCNELLGSQEKGDALVRQLVSLAVHYGFDGWLLNVENELSEEQPERLKDLLATLTTQMHEALPHSEVLWYDAVTSEGRLHWQNALTDLNKGFFDVCDGIFLNYTWTQEHLERSASVAGKERVRDIFVGLDVFGRNFYEGGGFNTHKALEVVREFGLSAAVFAPGWTYETHSGWEAFLKAEHQLWHSLAPLLFFKGPTQLPFVTSFSLGRGRDWSDLWRQQNQPSFLLGPKKGMAYVQELGQEQVLFGERSGSTCLGFRPAGEEGHVPLLTCAFPLSIPILLSCVYKRTNPNWQMLLWTTRNQHHRKVLLGETMVEDGAEGQPPLDAAETASCLQNMPKDVHLPPKEAYQDSWLIRHFEVHPKEDEHSGEEGEEEHLVQIGLRLVGEEPLLLRWLSLHQMPSPSNTVHL